MSQEPFGDIPLFREIQKVLSSSKGPLNYEIARQVASAIVAGTGDQQPEADLAAAYSDAVHGVEGILSGYSRLSLDEPMRARVIGRSVWTNSTLDGWKWILERLAKRFGSEFARLGQGASEDAGQDPMGMAMGQVSSLLMGIQTGTMIGHLSAEALGRHDLPIPRDDDGMLFLVAPSFEKLCSEYGFERASFIRWIALQEVARQLIARAIPWVNRYLRGLLTDLIDSIEIDGSDLERRIVEMQSKGMEAIQEGMGMGALPIVPSEQHRRRLDRVHSFVALFEGYARHSCGAVVYEVIPEAQRIEEGMSRHGVAPTDGEEMLKSILGLTLDRALENTGTTFCAAIVKLRGIDALNRVWDAPDNLPALDEIKDPFAWMERVLGDEGGPPGLRPS